MAKGSRSRLVWAFLLLPLLYTALLRLRCNVSHPLRLWKLQLLPRNWPQSLSVTISNDTSPERKEFTRFILRRLVRGSARRQLRRNGVTCVSEPESDICITTDAVRISTGGASPTMVYLTGNQHLPDDAPVRVRPYARKTDTFAMARTSPVAVLANPPNPPPSCDVNHTVPAVVFSNGGFAGNFFHDINDVLIPLFLTSSHFHSRVQLVVTDFEGYWVRKYRRVLSRLSDRDIVVASSSSSSPVQENKVIHCFPAAVVGLKYHGNLLCNSTSAPGGISTANFRNFIHASLSLNEAPVAGPVEEPVMVLLSRRKSRMLLNEEEVVGVAESVGFRVVVATAERMRNVQEFSEVVNGCSVLMGVHGAGMTNMVFLRPGAVLVQVVPWGLDWAAAAYYGRPALRMGLRYVEYHIRVEESSLYEQYPKDHPVLVDPWGINLKGYNVSKPVYTDGQNVRLDLSRFRETLLNARKLIPS